MRSISAVRVTSPHGARLRIRSSSQAETTSGRPSCCPSSAQNTSRSNGTGTGSSRTTASHLRRWLVFTWPPSCAVGRNRRGVPPDHYYRGRCEPAYRGAPLVYPYEPVSYTHLTL